MTTTRHAATWIAVSATALALALAPTSARSQAQGAKPAPPRPASGALSYTVEPAPDWIVPAAESPVTMPAVAGMHYRIIDDQVRIEGRSQSSYSHVIRVADDAGGLARASQIELEFDPSYQTLAMHHLEVVRNGQHLDRLAGHTYQVLQRETQLERLMYDGRATMSIVLDDVRVGDQIDFAYTIRGANPVFDGQYVDTQWMSSHRGAVALYQLRLLAPADRPIQIRVGPPDATTRTGLVGTMRETVLRRQAVPQLSVEQGAPYWAVLDQQVQFSEFADWAAVARWGQGVFAQGAGGARVEARAAEIRRSAKTREERLLAALRFVQREVRYFGNEVGVGSHRPEAPDKVIERRFGDCKDKVTLLIALLKHLDIEAQPVLVSTYLNGHLDTLPATPLAFNHVIARVDLDGRTYWLDATRTHQSGPLSAGNVDAYGRGLVIAPATTALAELPPPWDVDRMVVEDTIRIDSFVADPVLVSRITYRGELADGYREQLTSRSLADIATDMASAYVKIYPGLHARAPLRVEPAADDDAITFVQEFTVSKFWRFPEQRHLVGDVVLWGVLDSLVFPRAERRRDPLAFARPGKYRHSVTVQFAEDVFPQASNDHTEDGDDRFQLRVTMDADRRRTVYGAELRIGTDEVTPQEWSPFIAKVAQMRPRLAMTTLGPTLPLSRIDEVNRDLRAAEYAIRTKRVTLEDDEQAQAMYRTISLSARIDAGRLAPPLLAQAHVARAQQYARLGRTGPASDDFERAVLLAPEDDDVVDAAATHALHRGDLGRALSLAGTVLKRNPRDADALLTRALAHYFQDDAAATQADLSDLLKQGGAVGRGYPIVWLSMAMKQSGQDIASIEKRYPASLWPREWPRPLVDMAVGRSTGDALVEAARTQKQPGRALAQSYFFIGELSRTAGDLPRAREYWRKAAQSGEAGSLERAIARLRLERFDRP